MPMIWKIILKLWYLLHTDTVCAMVGQRFVLGSCRSGFDKTVAIVYRCKLFAICFCLSLAYKREFNPNPIRILRRANRMTSNYAVPQSASFPSVMLGIMPS